MSKADDLAYEMAKYIVAGLPIPDNLYDDLMREVCEEEKQKRQGGKLSNSKEVVETI